MKKILILMFLLTFLFISQAEKLDNFNNTPLHLAVIEPENISEVKKLIQTGADINARDIFGQTPIFKAIYSDNIEAVKILLKNGALLEITENNGLTPFYIAVYNKKHEIVKIILDHYYNNNIDFKWRENYNFILLHQFLAGAPFNLKKEFIKNQSNFYLIIFLIILILYLTVIKKNNKYYYLPFASLIFLFFILKNNMIIWDEWTNYDFWISFKTHNYKSFLEYLFIPHGVHPLLIPRLIILSISIVTGFSPWIFSFFSILLHFLSLYLIFKKNNFKQKSAVILFIICMFFFSLRQLENFFWGFQIAFIFCYFTSILCFYYLEDYYIPDNNKTLYKSILCAFIASFSSLMGGLCFIPVLYYQIKNKKRDNKIFLTTIILTIIIYSYNLFFIIKTSSQNLNLTQNIFKKINTFFLYIGGALTHNYVLALFACGLFFILIIWLYFFKNNFKIENEIFNQCVLFYSIFTGLLISLGRSEWGEITGLVSRYSTFSIAGFISIFFIFLNINNFKFSKFIKNTMLFTFIISSTFYWIYGIISVKEIYDSKNFYHNLLIDENYGLQKIDYRFYFWNKNIIEKYIENQKIKE